VSVKFIVSVTEQPLDRDNVTVEERVSSSVAISLIDSVVVTVVSMVNVLEALSEFVSELL
jgi:hypothetical protein